MPCRRALFALGLMLALPRESGADVVDVRFNFTPFVGDARADREVTTVPGRVRVFVNGIPAVEQDVAREPAQVTAHAIAPAFRLSVESLGEILRRGPNRIRFEFEPRESGRRYRVQLCWAEVQGPPVAGPDLEGREERWAAGPCALEQDFQADFAIDRPWHHATGVTSLSGADRVSLAAFVNQRLLAYAEDSGSAYALLEGAPGIDVAAARKLRCIEQAHAAGLRIVGPSAQTLEMLTTGQAEVVLTATDGPLYRPVDASVVASIPGEDVRMCAGLTLMRAYPPRLVVVRDAKHGWRTVE